MPTIRFLVVFGFSDTADIFLPTRAFSNVDFPTLGLPTIEIKPEWKSATDCILKKMGEARFYASTINFYPPGHL